jgi:hypothetical protein
MKKHILASAAGISLLIGSQAFGFYSTDFSTVNTFSNSAVNSSLGDGGAGGAFAYNTWWFSNGNGGINEAAEGRGDGLNPSASDNPISSIGLNRAQDASGTNARANWVVFGATDFTIGESYEISFDVIGGLARDGSAPGDTTGRFWVASLSGYDASGSNYIQMDGTHNGWGAAGATPFAANGAASVAFLTADDSPAGAGFNGQNIAGEELNLTTTANTFTFEYTGGDIGFAIGAYNNHFAIDDFQIAAVPEPSTYALLAGCFALTGVMIRRRR